MTSSSRIIPHLLEPYLRPQQTTSSSSVGRTGTDPDNQEPTLSIATSVLGASTNWLILRYLYAYLKQQPPQQQRGTESAEDEATTTNVVLVSFLRDYSFWKENAGRIGLDLDSLSRAGRFGFVDGLGVDLFHSSDGPGGVGNARGSLPGPGVLPSRPNAIVQGRQAPGATRGPVPVSGLSSGGRIPPSTSTGAASPGSNSAASKTSVLTNPTISHLRQVISDAIQKVGTQARTSPTGGKKSKLVLVIDQLDFLLAAAGGDISSLSLRDLLLDLRETAETTILTLSADQPLIDEQTTTLEKEHASFVLSLLHEADQVLSLRLLDTGVAKDVSGVIRITAGGGTGAAVEENEYLYHVRGDGGVRVFERGQ